AQRRRAKDQGFGTLQAEAKKHCPILAPRYGDPRQEAEPDLTPLRCAARATRQRQARRRRESSVRPACYHTAMAVPASLELKIDRSARAWQQVYATLRNAIVSARLEPGLSVSEQELAQRLGVSRT